MSWETDGPMQAPFRMFCTGLMLPDLRTSGQVDVRKSIQTQYRCQ